MLHDPDSNELVRQALLDRRGPFEQPCYMEGDLGVQRMRDVARRLESGFYFTPEAAALTAAALQEKFA